LAWVVLSVAILLGVAAIGYGIYWITKTIDHARADTDEAWKVAFSERDARAKTDSELIALQARLPPPPTVPPPLQPGDPTPTGKVPPPAPKKRRKTER
jgi:hypothetical protein